MTHNYSIMGPKPYSNYSGPYIVALMVAQNYRLLARNLIVIIKAPTLGFADQAMPPDLTLTRKAAI